MSFESFDYKSLSFKNYGILIAFIVNTLITYSSTVSTGPDGACILGKDNTYLSLKYQSLFTPNGWAFSIWGLIFIGEGIFAIYQLMPSVRSSKTVELMAYPWIGSCFFQILWCIIFAQEHIFVSTFMMLGILVFLMIMQYELLYVNDEELGYLKWWGLQAGPLLHLGWIIAASLLNINVSLAFLQPIKYNNGSLTIIHDATNDSNRSHQISVFIISVAFALLLGIYQVFGTLLLTKKNGSFQPHRAGTITAFAVAWGLFGIFDQLRYPKSKTTSQFQGYTINFAKAPVLFIASTIMILVGINILLLIVQFFLPSLFQNNKTDDQNHSAAPYLEKSVV